jgi:ribokinase
MVNPPLVLVVGSLHHDIMIEADHLPRRDETAVGRRWYPKFGGKGGNQAVAAQAAGARARIVSAVGKDGFGDFLLAALDRAGVDRRFVCELADVGSGMSVAIQDAAGDYAATIVSGANLRLGAGDLDDPALWQDAAIVVLQNEVAPELNLAAATRAEARGIPVILNAAPARAVAPDLRARLSLLVVNAVEAEMLGAAAVTDLTTAEAAAGWLSQGTLAVIVTAGAQGLAGWSPATGAFRLPAEKVEVVSSHGAGDCLAGTLAAALAHGLPLDVACRIAAKTAAAHVAAPSGPGGRDRA